MRFCHSVEYYATFDAPLGALPSVDPRHSDDQHGHQMLEATNYMEESDRRVPCKYVLCHHTPANRCERTSYS